MREVELAAAVVEGDSPVLILKDKASSEAVPIWIAMPEFLSIFSAWRGWAFPRPLSHDLMRSILEAGEMRVAQVEVTAIREGVFHARVLVARNGGEPKALDARPSDAVALAVRIGAPILVAEEVFAQAGVIWDLRKMFLSSKKPEGNEHGLR